MTWQGILDIIIGILGTISTVVWPILFKLYKSYIEWSKKIVSSYLENYNKGLRNGELKAQVLLETEAPIKIVEKVYKQFDIANWTESKKET
jgi:hypothetical protein